MSQTFRLILKKLDITLKPDGKQHVLVWLACRGEIYIGEAFATEDEDDLLKAIVQATLQAINKSVTKFVSIKLIHCRQIFLTEVGQIVFVVILQVESENSPFLLPGISLFAGFTPEVAAKATLKALNRTLTRYF
ncbi:MAG: hypothetical protein HY819_04150 [Acidobacteria bacterium]|nr:hypothetical protein [Acidobacteriota bacterium]